MDTETLTKNFENYIIETLNSFKNFELSEDQKKQLMFKQSSLLMTNRLLSRKYVRNIVPDDYKKDLTHKVSSAINEDKPLKFLILYGGYKHFWVDSHPYIDWAEVYNLFHLIDYLLPLTKAHKQGVVLEYISEDEAVTINNNYPQDKVDAYIQSRIQLNEFLAKYLPENFKLTTKKMHDMYDTSLLWNRVNEALKEGEKEFDQRPKDEQEKLINRAYFNIMWKGKEDWSNLSEKEKMDKAKWSILINQLYLNFDFDYRGDYYAENIPLATAYGLSPNDNPDGWITLGTTKASQVDFWIGKGVAEYRNGKFIPKILTKNQFEKESQFIKRIDTNIVPLSSLNVASILVK